jgi:hypothetical protein
MQNVYAMAKGHETNLLDIRALLEHRSAALRFTGLNMGEYMTLECQFRQAILVWETENGAL